MVSIVSIISHSKFMDYKIARSAQSRFFEASQNQQAVGSVVGSNRSLQRELAKSSSLNTTESGRITRDQSWKLFCTRDIFWK